MFLSSPHIPLYRQNLLVWIGGRGGEGQALAVISKLFIIIGTFIFGVIGDFYHLY